MKRKPFRVLSIVLAFLMLFALAPSFSLFAFADDSETTLVVYPAPSQVKLNTQYTMRVRIPDGEWQNLDEYETTIGGSSSNKSVASFVFFDTDGPVEVEATYNTGTVVSARLRGLNQEFAPAIDGNKMTFTISGPTKLSLEVESTNDSNKKPSVNRNMMIFANPIEVDVPDPNDPDVIYLGPGYHTGDIVVPSGKTLYLAGGAAIKGTINLDNATNVKVLGRGVIDHPLVRAISADFANQVTIDGIIANDYGWGDNGGCAINLGNTSNVTITNFKAFSANKWGDAIDTFAAKNIYIKDVYIRSDDDCIAIYNARSNGGNIWYGDTKNIVMEDAILMPDLARSINIGTHGFPWAPGGGHAIEDITFKNIDIWVQNTGQRIQFICADGNTIQNVRFEDIRYSDTNQGRFVHMEVKSHDYDQGRGINNVYFKNVTYNGPTNNQNTIVGKDAGRKITNVTFENIVINGTLITETNSSSVGKFAPNNFVENLKFISTGDTAPEVSLQIPAATPVNLALNRAATASSGSAVSNANDSDTSTQWTAGDGNTGHWWMVDLGASKRITDGVSVMFPENAGTYKYKIETSNDMVNWFVRSDKTRNTSTEQVQDNYFYDMARYVRITMTGLPSGASASICNFEVLGEAYNLAENGATATASSANSTNTAAKGIDGSSTSRWAANNASAPHWFTVDMKGIRSITYGTQVSWEKSGVYKYIIETSIDNSNWTTVIDKSDNTSTAQVQTDYFTAAARYVRITVTEKPEGMNVGFYDFKIFSDFLNIALEKPVETDSFNPSYPAANGNDESGTTRWVAADNE